MSAAGDVGTMLRSSRGRRASPGPGGVGRRLSRRRYVGPGPMPGPARAAVPGRGPGPTMCHVAYFMLYNTMIVLTRAAQHLLLYMGRGAASKFVSA